MDFKNLPRKAYVVKQTEKAGGQFGHPGHTLRIVETPDSIVIHSITTFSFCQTSLEKEPVLGRKKRQVFDLSGT